MEIALDIEEAGRCGDGQAGAGLSRRDLPPLAKPFDVPIAAYNVSGEYGMIVAAVERGWVQREQAVMEVLTGNQAGRRGYDLDLFRQRGRWVLERLTQLCNSKTKSP